MYWIIREACPYKKYVERHGMHFSRKLREFASGCLENADGTSHRFSAEDVEKFTRTNNVDNVEDLRYVADKLYSDFFPKAMTTEDSVMRGALAIITDKDGYEGMPLKEFLLRCEEKGVEIDWTEMI